jgi:predicted amidohydrolase
MKLGIVQMEVAMGEKDANLDRAADRGAEIVVLPECCDIGWLADRSSELAEAYDGVFVSSIAEAGTAKSVYIVVGFTERDATEVFNSALMLAPGGEIVLHHRKINLLDIARDAYSVGTHLECADTEWGRLALTICADSWTPEPTKALSMMGTQVILSPSAWACDPGRERENAEAIKERYAARTRESGVFLVGADSVGRVTQGPWKGRVLHGSSIVYGPGGDLVAEAKTSEEDLLLVEVHPPLAGAVETARSVT